MTSRSTWKQRERKAAKLLFSERTPLSGGNSKITRSDSLSSHFYMENKLRAKDATRTLYEDTKAKALKEGKIPVLTLQQKHKSGTLIVIHSDDLEAFVFIMRKLKKEHESKSIQEGMESMQQVQSSKDSEQSMSVPWDDPC